jgi:hypothetical protein
VNSTATLSGVGAAVVTFPAVFESNVEEYEDAEAVASGRLGPAATTVHANNNTIAANDSRTRITPNDKETFR